MLRQRLLVVIVLVPLGIALISAGGWIYRVGLSLILAGAAWEYERIFRNGGYHPSAPILVGGTAALAIGRGLFGFEYSDLILALVVLAAMTWHVIGYEHGQDSAAVDFAITLGGVLYLGWLGAYLISLRELPEGKWWLLLALPAIWVADTAAFTIGRRFGRHKMTQRVSPNKSWEGYLAGVLFAIPGTGLFALLWSLMSPAMTFERGMLLGLVLSLLAPLGDLGESMIKRQFKVKDSGQLLPGHGGLMDRIDSWVWAGVISYYLIIWLW